MLLCLALSRTLALLLSGGHFALLRILIERYAPIPILSTD